MRLAGALKGLDAPTLKGIWQTAPYLHDGSAPTLMAVLTEANPEDRHGKTSHLTASEKERLAAYLMQLDDSETPPETGARPAVRDAGPELSASYSRIRGSLSVQGSPDGSGEPVGLVLYDASGRILKAFDPIGYPGSGRGPRGSLQWSWEPAASRAAASFRGLVVIEMRQGNRSATARAVIH